MPHPPIATPGATALARALEHNESIQETVEQSAAELCMISTVLKQEVPAQAQTGDVAQALQKADEIENRIQSSAEELAHVNQLLKDELKAREELERQLALTQARLEETRRLEAQGGAPAQPPSGEPNPH